MKYLAYAGLALLLTYEIWAIASDRSGDTISEIIWRINANPLIPFAFGLLMGHFFWQRRTCPHCGRPLAAR